jgi:hypothetical protein
METFGELSSGQAYVGRFVDSVEVSVPGEYAYLDPNDAEAMARRILEMVAEVRERPVVQ